MTMITLKLVPASTPRRARCSVAARPRNCSTRKTGGSGAITSRGHPFGVELPTQCGMRFKNRIAMPRDDAWRRHRLATGVIGTDRPRWDERDLRRRRRQRPSEVGSASPQRLIHPSHQPILLDDKLPQPHGPEHICARRKRSVAATDAIIVRRRSRLRSTSDSISGTRASTGNAKTSVMSEGVRNVVSINSRSAITTSPNARPIANPAALIRIRTGLIGAFGTRAASTTLNCSPICRFSRSAATFDCSLLFSRSL